MTECIDGIQFQRMVIHAAAAIESEKQGINELNVFPVPDGDTGTNMSLTLATAAAELREKSPQAIGAAAGVSASALLRGARGNSGVILSLLFRGFSKCLKDMETAGAADVAAALTEGVGTAYKAVMKPAEGTILTVSRLAARRAVEAAAERDDVEYTLQAAIEEGQLALADTVNQNPVLKKAGVVDAGGKGFLVILQGMLDSLRGLPMPEVETAGQEKADFTALSDKDITFTYDTVFTVRKTVLCSLEPLRSYLNSIGDSLVIGEDDDSFKVHVHTDIPGAALTEAQKYGQLELAKIENMRTQYEDLAAGRKTHSADELEQPQEAQSAAAPPRKPDGGVGGCAGGGRGAVVED
ncbi:MAG: DAK2 domain-containing protein, partial [Oscillospiraceae bacterium]|nr:DAK2 domain-containing protein [Oscillospiraceae bacterium]